MGGIKLEFSSAELERWEFLDLGLYFNMKIDGQQ